MTGHTCPNCEDEAVCSRREWVAIYNYRAALREQGETLARRLSGYGVYPAPSEDGIAFARRWAEGDATGPDLVCTSCLTPFARQEVGP